MSNRKIEISPSVLGADLMRLGEEIRMVEALGIHWLHLDNMDGHFAPNISFGPDFVRAIRRQTKLFLDTHLMLSEPMKYIEAYARAGADLITVHAEADDNCAEVLEAIHALGADCFITGEMRHHEALDALDKGCCIIEAGHFETENPVCEVLADALQNAADALQYNVTVFCLKDDPFGR